MAVSPPGQRAPFSTIHSLVAGAVLIVALVLLSPLPQTVRAGVSSLALVVLGVALSLGALRNARRCGGRRQRAWKFFTAGAVTALAGNGWSAAVGADPATHPSVGGEGLVALGLAFAVGALLSLRAVESRGPELVLLLLDGLVAGIAALLLTAITVYSQVIDSMKGPWLHQ